MIVLDPPKAGLTPDSAWNTYPHCVAIRFRPQRELVRRVLLRTIVVALIGPVFAYSDDPPLVLQSLQFSPTLIDTSRGAAQVTVRFTVTELSSRVNYFEAVFIDPSGITRRSGSGRVAPDSAGEGSVAISFPQFSDSGDWTLAGVFLSSAAGNTLTLDTSGIIKCGFPTRLQIKSIKDTASPQLTGLTFSPSAIDTSGGPVDVKVSYSATDDLSGISYIELSFASPSGAVRGGSAKLEPSRSVSDTINVTFPRFCEAGRWALKSLVLSDGVGNTLVLNREMLRSSGVPTNLDVRSTADTASPKLTSLDFHPGAIDTSSGPSIVKVNFAATDDFSGVKSIEVAFISPSGNAAQGGSATFFPVAKLANSVNVNFPARSEPGLWILRTVLLTDAAGNTSLLDADGAATFGVHPLTVVSGIDSMRDGHGH